jgi:hypothetical protein
MGIAAVRMMSCPLMSASCVLCGRFLMMPRRVLVVLGGLQMMAGGWVRHGYLLLLCNLIDH